MRYFFLILIFFNCKSSNVNNELTSEDINLSISFNDISYYKIDTKEIPYINLKFSFSTNKDSTSFILDNSLFYNSKNKIEGYRDLSNTLNELDFNSLIIENEDGNYREYSIYYYSPSLIIEGGCIKNCEKEIFIFKDKNYILLDKFNLGNLSFNNQTSNIRFHYIYFNDRKKNILTSNWLDLPPLPQE